MFSPTGNSHVAASSLNPRRRQRTGSDDSVALRYNPKRLRRSVLSSETFKPPSKNQVNGYIQHVQNAPLVNGHVHETRPQRDASVDTTSLAIRNRGSKKGEREKRAIRSDRSIELTKNDNYIVTQLSTTPDQVQHHPSSEKWRGEIAAQIGCAVAMTHKQATVWRYIQGINLKESSQPWIIKLPEAINDASGPLPFGLVVPTSAEPAFLIVTAAGGRITYWESLSSAANIDLNRQKQQGTQGAVSGMVTGEVITKVTEAEPHGFLLTFSTGRIAHMTVSDPQGKPLINVHYLRSGVARPGGLFGSLRNALSTAAWRRNVAAIKAGSSSQRGQRYAVVATTKGAFQVWDLNWNGAHSLVSEIDANEDLLKALKEGGNILEEKHHRFQVLDFTFLPRGRRGKELAKPTEQGDCNLLVLTIVSDLESSIYTLVGLNLSKGFVSIDVVHPISCYTSPYQAREDFKPQVLVPEPAQTAFVIFETSVVLVSLIELEDSPTSQLQMEAHTLPDPFQDVIDFRKDKDYRVVGCAAEPLDRTQSCSSCILLVDGFGAVRVAAQPVDEGQSVLDRATVTARTKLEQAVFYGNLPQDLLDFSGRPEIVFTDKEVAEAALEVSTSIMQSTSTYIPALSPSMEQQIHRRSVALADLMKHLVRHYQPLDRLTRWKLLWNAEKMAAAGAVWRAWNVTIAAKREHEKNLLVEIIDFLHEKFKTENDPERYETDAVRHWFVHDIGTLENILAWAPHAIEELERESREDKVKIDSFTKARYLSEANDIILSALETAFRFREANATLYGVGHELMVDGVLESGYEDLPEIWTAEPRLVTQVEILINSSRQTAIEYNGAEEEPIMKLIDKLMTNNPRLVEIWCHIYTERFRWLISSEDENIQIEGDKLRKSFFEVRKEMLMKLSDIGLGQQGIKLAAKYQDMNALVEIIDRGVKETTLHLQDKGAHDSEKDHYRDILLLLKNQVRTYFRQFHHQWAAAYFAKHISSGKTTEVFQEAANYQPYLTAFLLHPLYAKIGWINQVHAEHNYSAAADSLKVAQQREMRLWNKKIQLGMCKLAVLAAKTKKQEPDEDVNSYLCGIDQAMTVVRMQENLYNYIRPTVQIAMDLAAELDLVLEQYCKRYVKGKPALHKVLTRNLTQLVARDKLGTEDLIDTLTLIDEGKLHPHDEDFADKRFFCALNLLKVCKFMDGAVARTDLHEKIIWRRCMIQDDWEAINRTELKDDTQVEVETGATALFKTLKEGYKTDFFASSAPCPPLSVLGAGTSISSLRTSARYTHDSDNKLASLSRDLETEDALLEKYIEKGRLEMWWKGVAEAARRSALEERDQVGEDLRRRKSMELGFWRELEARDDETSDEDEHVERDGQGDVIMES